VRVILLSPGQSLHAVSNGQSVVGSVNHKTCIVPRLAYESGVRECFERARVLHAELNHLFQQVELGIQVSFLN